MNQAASSVCGSFPSPLVAQLNQHHCSWVNHSTPWNGTLNHEQLPQDFQRVSKPRALVFQWSDYLSIKLSNWIPMKTLKGQLLLLVFGEDGGARTSRSPTEMASCFVLPCNIPATALVQILCFGQFWDQKLVFHSYSGHYVNGRNVNCTELLERERETKQISFLDNISHRFAGKFTTGE